MTTDQKSQKLIAEVYRIIPVLRKSPDDRETWELFKVLIEENLDIVCDQLDTRWLVSVCDTYADNADGISRRNAMLVVQIANFEKLWATNLLMYDVSINEKKLKLLKKNKIIPLWDGMYSFNINHGDMINNFFKRVDGLMSETPVIEKIYYTVLERLQKNDTVLANLDKYHARFFSPVTKRSVLFIAKKKIRQFFRNYKL